MKYALAAIGFVFLLAFVLGSIGLWDFNFCFGPHGSCPYCGPY